MKRMILLAMCIFLNAGVLSAQDVPQPKAFKTDSVDGVIFPAAMKIGATAEFAAYDLGEMEVAEAEKIAKDYLASYLNTSPDDTAHQYYRFAVGVILGDFAKYRKQYAGLQDDKGQKIVYMNCFYYREGSDYFSNWKEQWVHVNAGGPAFYNLKVNLTTKQVIDFSVNEMA